VVVRWLYRSRQKAARGDEEREGLTLLGLVSSHGNFLPKIVLESIVVILGG